jgi:hypothetical protein
MRDGQRSGALRTLALVSGVYDLALAVPMLLVAPQLAAAMGAPPPVPLINAQLNGVFTLALAAGYFWAARDVEARRGYLWVAGVLAKGLGASLFVLDHFQHGSPSSFLLFAVTDGSLAVLTAILLRRS